MGRGEEEREREIEKGGKRGRREMGRGEEEREREIVKGERRVWREIQRQRKVGRG